MLHDVAAILGLGVDGDFLGDRDLTLMDTAVQILVANDPDTMTGYHARYFRVLPFAKLVEMLNNPDVDHGRQMVGWLTIALGELLFTEKKGDKFKPREIVEVSNIRTIGRHSWGSGVLAHMYRQLGLASRADTMSMGGCLSLLQTWIYEYFPEFRVLGEAVHPRMPPFASKWRTELHVSEFVLYTERCCVYVT